MRGGKRSAPLIVAALVACLTACSSASPQEAVTTGDGLGDARASRGGGTGAPRGIAKVLDPVAVLRTEKERAAGVNGVPLDAGQSLLFVLPKPGKPVWNMAGVEYPLVLVAIDAKGRYLGSPVPMLPCSDPGDDCPTYDSPAPSRYFAELRPE